MLYIMMIPICIYIYIDAASQDPPSPLMGMGIQELCSPPPPVGGWGGLVVVVAVVVVVVAVVVVSRGE